MRGEHFDIPVRAEALRDSPGGSLLEEFAQWLRKAGYAEITVGKHIRGAEHFTHWTERKRIPVCSLNKHVLRRFGSHLSRCRCPGYRYWTKPRALKSARLFLEHLRDCGVINACVAEPTAKQPALLTAFCQWMREQRSTGDRALRNYSRWISDFLSRHGEDPHKFDAQSLRAFVLKTNQQRGWASAKHSTTALRMFLRFLIAEGKCAAGLDAAVPVVARWRLSSLPRYLQPEEVERVIASCNRGARTDKRDRAILLLLARLGLRAGDVANLRLSDIDWQGAWIAVSGKAKRQARLPLTQQVGDAIATYLQNERPHTNSDVLFIRTRAPIRALADYRVVSVIVKRAMQRAGVSCPSRGAAHVLRHSAATSMLRHGASLQDIAAVLRHRSIETTQIYAKVDATALRRIAQPWPGVRPC
ncbi:MAG TPA: site-specific integrase [Terriglobales bacterium]|nr:site-specific integrase [Terriglobales bacterium]